MADQEPTSTFTTKDVSQLAIILTCLKEGTFTNAMVDIPKFAKKAGLTEGSAKNALIRIRKKIDEEASAPSEPAAPATTKAKKPAAKGKTNQKKAVEKENSEEDTA